MIKAILFDCFGVLANDVWLAFCAGLPADADVEHATAINRAYDKGLLSRHDFEQGVLQAVGSLPPLLEDMKPGEMVRNEPLFGLIKGLAPNYKIGLLSNIYGDWITKTFLTNEDKALFDDIVQSYEVGLTKPDPRIYLLACSRLGVDPEEAIMIDDRLSNVDGATAAGLYGIVYDTFVQCSDELTRLLNSNE